MVFLPPGTPPALFLPAVELSTAAVSPAAGPAASVPLPAAGASAGASAGAAAGAAAGEGEGVPGLLGTLMPRSASFFGALTPLAASSCGNVMFAAWMTGEHCTLLGQSQ